MVVVYNSFIVYYIYTYIIYVHHVSSLGIVVHIQTHINYVSSIIVNDYVRMLLYN